MPDGWSVDVDSDKVLVTIPAGDEYGRRLLSRHEARVLRVQLHLAQLLAGRNYWTAGVGTDISREQADSFSALIRDRLDLRRIEITDDERADLLARHRERVERYGEELARAADQSASGGLVDHGSPEWDVLGTPARAFDEVTGSFPTVQLPEGWRIEISGPLVRLTVPASAADGEFELTDVEALSAGIVLIQFSAIARSVRSAIEESSTLASDLGAARQVPETDGIDEH